jgi:glycerol-3-phosphate dehydrogenase (NAD(P)+)
MRRMSEQRPVAVIGGGVWGVALAAAAARNRNVFLVSRRKVSSLPKGVTHSPIMDPVRECGLVILAVPSSVAKAVAREVGDHTDGSHFVVHGVRGLVSEQEEGSPAAPEEISSELLTIGEVALSQIPSRRIGALGGPALAEEILQGKPSVLVCGSRFPEVREAVIGALGSKSIRVYPTQDLKGLEWASALVGCMAVSIGFASERGMGAGLIAALICRSMGEAARIAESAGGDERTLLGLAGYGDLLASIEQEGRPEVQLGRALAKGKPLAKFVKDFGQRIEAVELIPRIFRWTYKHSVRAPIFQALAESIEGRLSGEQVVERLMTLPIELGA